MKFGKNGKLWIVKQYGKKHRWIVSSFYKKFIKSVKKVRKLIDKSPVNIKINIPEDILTESKFSNWFDTQIETNIQSNKVIPYFIPEIYVEIEFNNIGELIGDIEWTRIACLSGFYKYVTNSGSDYGPVNSNKIPIRGYFYSISSNGSLWTDFNKECKKYHTNNINYLHKITKKLKQLDNVNKLYIENNYSISLHRHR